MEIKCRLQFATRSLATGALIAIIAGGVHTRNAQARATFVTFDVPAKGTTIPTDINKFGEVVGFFTPDGGQPTAFWRATDGTIETLEVNGQTRSFADGLNDNSDVVGTWTDSDGHTHCFFAKLGRKFLSCEPLGFIDSQGNGINNIGQVVGDSTDLANAIHGIVWTRDGGAQSFDCAKDAQETHGIAIDDSGAIAGYCFDSDGHEHGFVGSLGAFTTFNVPGDAGGTFPLRIRDGAIAGDYFDSNFVQHSFSRDAGGNIVGFDPPGASQSEAADINAHGVIVGGWTDAFALHHGYMGKAAGTLKPLDVPKSIETFAHAINNTGMIAGQYTAKRDRNHQFSGFIRTP